MPDDTGENKDQPDLSWAEDAVAWNDQVDLDHPPDDEITALYKFLWWSAVCRLLGIDVEDYLPISVMVVPMDGPDGEAPPWA